MQRGSETRTEQTASGETGGASVRSDLKSSTLFKLN